MPNFPLYPCILVSLTPCICRGREGKGTWCLDNFTGMPLSHAWEQSNQMSIKWDWRVMQTVRELERHETHYSLRDRNPSLANLEMSPVTSYHECADCVFCFVFFNSIWTYIEPIKKILGISNKWKKKLWICKCVTLFYCIMFLNVISNITVLLQNCC